MMKIIVALVMILSSTAVCAETYVDAKGTMKMHINKSGAVAEVPEYSNPKEIIRTESEQVFIVVLDSNRTTGYEWQIGQPFDNLALELVGKEYVSASSGMPGAGGKEKWTFRALAFRRDAVPLLFKYVRPWEKDVRPEKELNFKVIINKGPAERQLASMQKELDRLRNDRWTEHLGQ